MSRIDESFFQDLDFGIGDFSQAPNGDFEQITGVENLKQRLFHRLITVKGTLAHRPLYGVGLPLYQNSLGSIGKQRELALEIKNQFLEDSGVESVDSVIVKQEKDGQFLIQYKVTARGIGSVSDSASFEDFSL